MFNHARTFNLIECKRFYRLKYVYLLVFNKEGHHSKITIHHILFRTVSNTKCFLSKQGLYVSKSLNSGFMQYRSILENYAGLMGAEFIGSSTIPTAALLYIEQYLLFYINVMVKKKSLYPVHFHKWLINDIL